VGSLARVERPRCRAGRRSGLRRRPRPHNGTILVETRHMEGDLRLVREGHRDRLAVHGVRTPRTGPAWGRVPLLRPCGPGSVSALPPLHSRQAFQRVSDYDTVRQVADPAHAAAASGALLADMGGVTPPGTRGMLLHDRGGVPMRQSWAFCCSGVPCTPMLSHERFPAR
jgi:hypothetical protein